MNVKIIADPGSCHCGRKEWAHEFIDQAMGTGADAVKYQLFLPTVVSKKVGNVALPYEWFPELVEHGASIGVEVFASAFDAEALALIEENCKAVKFAYPKREWGCNFASHGSHITHYISGDLMTAFPYDCIRLYCIPEYPVPYEVAFDGLFPDRFDGFSDHTMGYRQTLNAVRAGAKYIEKHTRLDYKECDDVPDGKFALYPAELKDMVQAIRAIEYKQAHGAINNKST